MNKKLYIGNLSYDATEDEITDLFSEFGQVESLNIIVDKFNQRPKGFAFIEMSTEEEAEAAQKALNGQEFMERTLKVDEVHDKPRSDSRSDNRRNFRGGRNNNRNDRNDRNDRRDRNGGGNRW